MTVPDQDEIRALCLEVQATWSATVEQSRRAIVHKVFEFPIHTIAVQDKPID